MRSKKTREAWEFGDFQTPLALAREVCQVLKRKGILPASVLEPSCGLGAFVQAAAEVFPEAQVIGVDINPQHVASARERLRSNVGGGHVDLYEGDFFKFGWDTVLTSGSKPWLILGNPPWVTNAELSLLASSNLPKKSNFQNDRGIDSITGKGNFDISEWMLMRYLDWLQARGGHIAVLVKTIVARKVLLRAWKARYPISMATVHAIDATKYFGVSVDACLLTLSVEPCVASSKCDVFEHLYSEAPSHMLGFKDGLLISNMRNYQKWRHLAGRDQYYLWRSGIKHDCSRVMEIISVNGRLRNGLGEEIELEPSFLYPMLKSSDVYKSGNGRDRFMIVTQLKTGQETGHIRVVAPQTWEYLQRHAELLARRSSSIYRNRPQFSVFGVGDYSFAPWKLAISGFYKALRFVPVGPVHGKPTVLDDTVYFLPCQSQAEAEFLSRLLNSTIAQEFYGSMIFWADKRPVTSELLRRLDIAKLAA